MEKTFKISVVRPDKVVYEGVAISVIAPGDLGYLGILANHAPLVSAIVPGKLTIRENLGNSRIIQLEDRGFLEVLKNKVTILLS